MNRLPKYEFQTNPAQPLPPRRCTWSYSSERLFRRLVPAEPSSSTIMVDTLPAGTIPSARETTSYHAQSDASNQLRDLGAAPKTCTVPRGRLALRGRSTLPNWEGWGFPGRLLVVALHR